MGRKGACTPPVASERDPPAAPSRSPALAAHAGLLLLLAAVAECQMVNAAPRKSPPPASHKASPPPLRKAPPPVKQAKATPPFKPQRHWPPPTPLSPNPPPARPSGGIGGHVGGGREPGQHASVLHLWRISNLRA